MRELGSVSTRDGNVTVHLALQARSHLIRLHACRGGFVGHDFPQTCLREGWCRAGTLCEPSRRDAEQA